MRSLAGPVPLLVTLACAPHVHEDDAAHSPSDDDRAGLDAFAASDSRSPAVGPVLATLVTREHRVAVRTADGRTLFTVMDAQGHVLSENLGLWQLARDYPRLHRQYETAFAGEGIELDARVPDFVHACEGCSPQKPE